MKIRYLSDIHLEFIKTDKIEEFIQQIPPGPDEICILAGDIGNPYKLSYVTFMKYISKNFKKTFVIAGNHEYYYSTIIQTNEFLKNYFSNFNNISFLNNTYECYENYCFIGTTLWSKITDPLYKINDINYIFGFDIIMYNKLHKESIDFLENTLKNNTNCIVITHHMPSNSLIDQKYLTPDMLPYNQWFASNLDKLIEKRSEKIRCWIYGHTHCSLKSMISGVPMLCNPIGYPGENEVVNLEERVIF